MRVISGRYGGRVLKSPPDLRTRPTSDRLRESLFNIIAPRLNDKTRFLDLCSGTGAVGIEALSRGVEFASFVDISRKACALIEENLDNLSVSEALTEVYCESAEKFLSRSEDKEWDVVFYDPPYNRDYAEVIGQLGGENSCLASDGLLVVEHHSKNKLVDLVGNIRRWRLVKQGESHLSFFEPN